MKRYMVVWGFVFFLVMFCSLYLMLETINTNKPVELDTQSLDTLERKIKKIEEDTVRNHEVIKQIKETVRKLVKGDNTGLERLGEVVDVVHTQRLTDRPVATVVQGIAKDEERYSVMKFAVSEVEHEVCSLAEKPILTADIKMSQVFDENKFDDPDGGVWKQGWDIQYNVNQWNQNNKLQVFVVPHSHTDPGWLRTFEDYYKLQTRKIFENMVPKLEEDVRRKFIYAEISFFSLWWNEIDEAMRNRVKRLLSKGQLEIVTGGWVMTDEANAHYFAMIDQLIEGHQWLDGTLGVKPKSGWAIDPFGYSSTMAYLLKRSGFSNMLIQRVHYSIKKYLAQQRNMEFMWRQQWDRDGSTDILCHLMPFYSYDIPHTCGPDPAVCCQFDFRRLPGSSYKCPWKISPVAIHSLNVQERATTLLDQYRKKSQLYKTNVLFVPLGDDFRYDTPEEWDKQFNNYQKIFDYLNSRPELGVQTQFGTLTDYFTALYKSQGVADGVKPSTVSTLSGDFFTYADREDHYWSGYFTSRPFYKNLDRLMESHLRSAEVIFSLALSYARKVSSTTFPSVEFMTKLVEARRNLGLFQHHDGITGTAKDFVVVDYGQRLHGSLNDLKSVITECATYLMSDEKDKYRFKGAPFFNVDEIRESQDSLPKKMLLEVDAEFRPVLIYNSLAHKRSELVKLVVNRADVEVRDAADNVIHTQAEPFWVEKDQFSRDKFKIAFVADVAALGISQYRIRAVSYRSNPKHHVAAVTLMNCPSLEPSNIPPFDVKKSMESEEFHIENHLIKATFAKDTGLLKSVVKADGSVHTLNLTFVMYGVKNAKEKSGAYLFLPDGEAKPMIVSHPLIRIIRGPIVSEVHVLIQYVEHVVRLSSSPGSDGASVDIANTVDIRHLFNNEIALRINTNIDNQDRVFFTDLNGFQMQRRKMYDKLPLQANYYPMTSMAFLEDGKTRLSILTKQSLGVASLKKGQIEVMLDRRLNQDDNRGLGQGVLDNKKTPNRFRLLLETRKSPQTTNQAIGYPSLLSHISSFHLVHPLHMIPKNTKGPDMKLRRMFVPMSTPLPCEIHLVNLRTMQNRDDSPELKHVPRETAAIILHRLVHDCSFETHSLSCLPSNGKVIFKNMFKDLKLKNIHSTSLTLMHVHKELDPSSVIQLQPMEINTYRIALD
ncbi:alpha-mannosidase 2x-like isoform X2 [Gigantopelta aegis]|uniref:alpha-mannosidase 2x-like isoform X2 n=1 Tax=Gigantopelta aegis TaxID=1735272 RepID=UPI001B88B849|nr:alpha-mannosidase 2x-like isoform X2 [Gigantopelta aegis]